MSTSKEAARTHNNRVGPILRAGEIARAALEAVEQDNPGKEIHVDDRSAYIRIECDDECILTRQSISEALGRPFEMRELEINLGSFSGNIDTAEDRIRFYFNKHV